MKRLLIDAGNSRLKWASASGARLGRVQSAAWSRRNLPALARRIVHAGRAADAILVCNVAGAAVQRALRAAARAAGAPAPRFIASSRAAGGVRNAYRAPRRLGVDRWLALIGAHHLHPRQPLCVISCGTATTVDLLDRRGRHLGGAIIPGPELMVGALLRDTALIRRRAQPGRRSRRGGMFTSDTRAAIEAGARHARLAVIRHAVEEAAARLRGAPRLVLTGGGAAPLASRLSTRPEPLLIFSGLLVLARRGEV